MADAEWTEYNWGMTQQDFRSAAGKRIKQERKKLGWSQEVLAEKADLHPSFIGQIERGERAASFKTLERFSRLFGVKLTELLEDGSGHEPYKPHPLEKKIVELLKGCSSREQQLVYQTIKHLLRQNRKLAK